MLRITCLQVTPGPHAAGHNHQQVFPSDTSGSQLPEQEPLLLRAKEAERQENLRHKKELIRCQRAQRITSTRRKTRSLARTLLCSGDSDLESGGEEVDITKFLPPLFTASTPLTVLTTTIGPRPHLEMVHGRCICCLVF